MNPTFTTLEEVKNHFAGKPGGTQCYLKSASTGPNVQCNLNQRYGTYVSYTSIETGLYLLEFVRYDPEIEDAYKKKMAAYKVEQCRSKNTGVEPTWKDIKDCTNVGETKYVVMNKDTLRRGIARNWGAGAGVAKIEKNGVGWNVTRLK